MNRVDRTDRRPKNTFICDRFGGGGGGGGDSSSSSNSSSNGSISGNNSKSSSRVNKNPRCNSMQIFIYCKVTLHVSGVTAPIIRSTKNCSRSLRYRS